MRAGAKSPKGIKDVFYETRVLMGREYTLRRFATETLGGAVDPVMLGYIEKGTRFPNEALVRRLAAIRKQDAHELLALLWRDRMVYAFGRELRKVLNAPRAVTGIEDAELAVATTRAIAALPDDGSWIPVARWRQAFRTTPRRGVNKEPMSDELARKAEDTLRAHELVEVQHGRVRRRGRHFVAESLEEKQSLALEFCTLFIKSLLDKLALPNANTGTYLRDHYLNVEPERLPEFHQRLDAALRGLAEEFAADPSAATRFLNVLVTATPY
jgi:hypothetical protein